MGIFGSRKPMGYYTGQTAARDPLGLGMAVDPQMAGMASRGDRPGFFGAGGAGRGIAGVIGDALLSASGRNPIYAPLVAQQRQQQQEDERWEKRLTHETQAKRQTPQAVNLGNGGFGVWSPDGGLQIEREPEAQVKPTPLQQNADYLRTLNPNLTDEQLFEIVQRALPGYGNSDEVYDQRRQLKATAPGKAPSAGGGGGGQYEYKMVDGKLLRRRVG